MKKFSQLAFPYIVWAILMLVFPMVLIALYSVTDQGNSILSFTFTLEHYAKFFTDPDFLLILWRSIVIAVKTTVICLLLGYPIAYYIARSEQKKQNALILVIIYMFSSRFSCKEDVLHGLQLQLRWSCPSYC